MHNLEVLVKGKERCTLQMHPDDAGAAGVRDGEEVQVSNLTGSITVRVEVTEDIMPGVVSIPHGWGHGVPGVRLSIATRRPGVNSNLLASTQAMDALSGNAVLNAIPVTVERA
jgi:anaerobic selenocysteine-containing dehydrogenase